MSQPLRYLHTPEEYLRLEENSTDKHEFIEGGIYLIAGGSLRHNALTVNIAAELNIGLRGKPCVTFSSDMRLSPDIGAFYAYADVSVVCGTPELAPGGNATLTNPTVIVEVLSPSTENYDRGKKAEYYRRFLSLKSYLIVDQGRVFVEHYCRQEDNSWSLEIFTDLSEQISLPSLGLVIPLINIHDKINLN